MSKPIPQVSDRWADIELWNHGVVRYPTTTGHWLEVGQGKIPLKFRFDLDDGGDLQRLADERYNLACLHRVADNSGQVWQARTCFRPSLFIYRLLDLNHVEYPLWQHNAEPWLEAIQQRPLLTGLYVLLDDRFYRRFWIDDALLEIQFKYQGITIDVGLLDKDRLAVRLRGWFGTWNYVPMDNEGGVSVYQGGPIRPPETRFDEVEDPQREYSEDIESFAPGGWLENLSPMIYTLWIWDVLFRSDASWENDYPVPVPFPRPILWELITEELSDPLENVRIVTTA